MTSITVEIPVERLRDPEVNRALQKLTTALALHVGMPPGKHKGKRGTGYVVQTTVPKRYPEADPNAPEAIVPAALETAWRAYVESLDERMQGVTGLIEREGSVTAAQLGEALELSPKGVGGVMGALMRWATANVPHVPIAGARIAGGRGFRWIGFER